MQLKINNQTFLLPLFKWMLWHTFNSQVVMNSLLANWFRKLRGNIQIAATKDKSKPPPKLKMVCKERTKEEQITFRKETAIKMKAFWAKHPHKYFPLYGAKHEA